MTGRVLVVAGSDSGGGAGVQADIKTITALGGYAATAITALTAQNTQQVNQIDWVDPAFVAQQMQVVLDDIGADVIKLGMLGSAETIEAVADVVASLSPQPLTIVDPVLVATSGDALAGDETVTALKQHILPTTYLLTPNLPEAEALTGLPIDTADDLLAVGEALLVMGPKNVLIKGGHGRGDELVDVLFTGDDVVRFPGERIESRNTHGTGCTLASAIAVSLAQGLTLTDAIKCARDYVRKAIRTAPGLGSGHGPLNHGHPLQNG